MIRRTPKRPKLPLEPRVARYMGSLIRSFAMARTPAGGPGEPQRRILQGLYPSSVLNGPRPTQRLNGGVGMHFTGDTPPPVVIPPPLGLESVDPVAGVSAQGAGTRPRLPGAKQKLPVR